MILLLILFSFFFFCLFMIFRARRKRKECKQNNINSMEVDIPINLDTIMREVASMPSDGEGCMEDLSKKRKLEREQKKQRLVDIHDALTVHVVIGLLKTAKDYYETDLYEGKIKAFKQDDAYRELKKRSTQPYYDEFVKKGVAYWNENHKADDNPYWASVLERDYIFLKNPTINIKKHIEIEMKEYGDSFYDW